MPVVLEEGNMRALDIGYLDRIKVLPKTVKTLEAQMLMRHYKGFLD